MIVLAGDIGGTRTRLALVTLGPRPPRLVGEQDFATQQTTALAPLVHDFLARQAGPKPERACFGVAGPVVDGHVRLSNVDWELDEAALGSAIGIPTTRIINDFAAIGYAIPLLTPDDAVALQAGTPHPHAPIAIIGAGTGLGHAYLVWGAGGYHVQTSEAGHADFAPRTPLEAQLAGFLRTQHAHVSWERVVSGPGLVSTYEFLATRGASVDALTIRALLAEPDPAAAVTARALAGSDMACVEALDIFISAYGAQAANFALAIGALGGVYIAGGIAPRILAKLSEGEFLRAFRAKGRLADVLSKIPVRVITRAGAGLIGAAVAAGGDEPLRSAAVDRVAAVPRPSVARRKRRS